MRLAILILALLPLACGGGSTAPGVGGDPDAYLGQPFPIAVGGAGEAFSFVVLSDTHVRLPGGPDDVFFDNQGNLDAFRTTLDLVAARSSETAFVVVTGDLVGALLSDDADDYGTGTPNPAETFADMVSGLGLPVHVCLGNHDYQKDYDASRLEGIPTEDLSKIEAVWRKVLGVEPYYAIVHEGVRLVFLNSNRGVAGPRHCPLRSVESFCTGSFDEVQLAWLEAELSAAEPCLLFFHHPPRTDHADSVSFDLDSFLVEPGDGFYPLSAAWAPNIAGIFVGHGHVWAHDSLHDTIPVFETEAVADPGGVAGSGHVVTVDPAGGAYVVERLR